MNANRCVDEAEAKKTQETNGIKGKAKQQYITLHRTCVFIFLVKWQKKTASTLTPTRDGK